LHKYSGKGVLSTNDAVKYDNNAKIIKEHVVTLQQ